MTATALGALDRLMPEVTNPTAEGVLDLMRQRDSLSSQIASLESVRDQVRALVGAGPAEEDGTPTVDAVRKAIEERAIAEAHRDGSGAGVRPVPWRPCAPPSSTPAAS